jgi:F-type H+-transporting ATPase subunit a
MTCVISQYYHIKMNGIKEYLKGFLGPVKFMIPIMLPMNIISEIANPVSLTLRMFGNLLGGLIIGTLIYSMLVGSNVMPIWVALGSIVLCVVLLTKQYKKIKDLDKGKKKLAILLGLICCAPLCIMAFVHGYFDIFSGCLQTYIFCLLSMIFISP